MSSPDYELHINRDRFNSLWDSDDDTESFPFSEDTAELDRIIEEEIGAKPARLRRKRSR